MPPQPDPTQPTLSPHTIRLLRLIHTPPSPQHLSQATSVLSNHLRSCSPPSLWLCLGHLTSFLYDPSSLTRSSAASALASLSKVIPAAERSKFLSLPYASSEALSLSLFETPAPLAAAPLLFSGTSYKPLHEAFVDSASTPAERLERQRIILKERLGLGLGADEKQAITYNVDTTALLSVSDFSPPSKRAKADPDEQLPPSALSKLLLQTLSSPSSESSLHSTPMQLVYSDLLTSLLSPLYTRRHGALLALSCLLRAISTPPSTDLTCRILAVLVLERFGDYSSTPTIHVNRELAAQTLAYIYRNVPSSDKTKLWTSLTHLASLPDSPDVLHGVLLCFKYTVLFAPASSITPPFLSSLQSNLSSPNDSVASAACQTLTSLYSSTSHTALAAPYCSRADVSSILSSLDPLSHSLLSFLSLLSKLPPAPPPPPLLSKLLQLLAHDTAAVRSTAAAVLSASTTPSLLPPVAVPTFRLLLSSQAQEPSLVALWGKLVSIWAPEHRLTLVEVLLTLQQLLPPNIDAVVALGKLLVPLLRAQFDEAGLPALRFVLGSGRVSRRSYVAWLVLLVHLGGDRGAELAPLVANRMEGASGFDDTLESENLLLMGLRAALLGNPSLPSSAAPPPPPTKSASLSVDDMRLSSLISTCLFLKGSHKGRKLTPLIRPVMTSVLNETDATYGDLNDAGVMAIVDEGGKPGKSVAAKVVDLAATSNANARRCLRLIVQKTSATQPVCGEGGICHSICATLGGSGASFVAPSQEALGKALNLLHCVADVLASADVALATCAVPNLAAVSTDHPSEPTRSLATLSLATLARHPAALDSMLPTLKDSLGDIGNDARRENGSAVLLAILRALGVDVKERVCDLLGMVMGGMGDVREVVSKSCAEMFAMLIRVAPLVPVQGDASGDNAVIRHLIHGKPLPPVEVGAALAAKMKGVVLRKYQSEGVTWLNFLMDVNLNGILSDEMGLGKTLQSLVAIAMRHEKEKAGQEGVSLIVCPSTLVDHWVGEVGKFFKDGVFRCVGYGGGVKERREKKKRVEAGGVNLIVTSYSVLRNELAFLTGRPYLCAVLDEGHLLKNPNTATAKAARKVRAKHKVILSGTPVQNRVQELWAAFDFLMPNFLGSERTFQREYGKVIGESLKEGEEQLLVGEAKVKLKQLHQQVLPFILRREKKDVLSELPNKVITDIACDLSTAQRRMYAAFVGKREKMLKGAIDAAGKPEGGGDTNVFKALLFLRLLCVHPSLVSGGAEEDDGGEEFLDGGLKYDKLEHSGKLTALKELLFSSGIGSAIVGADNDVTAVYVNADLEERKIEADDRNQGDEGEDQADEQEEQERQDTEAENKVVRRKDGKRNKCLVFAQHTKALDVVENYLLKPFMPNTKYLRLDGRVASGDRFNIAKRFNEDDDVQVLLLTTKVGGLGLNLTGANIVVFLENAWNPVDDLQAMDRCHRIGQTESVNVYRIVTKGTVEEKIMKMQRAKVAQSDAVVTSENSSMFAMGTDRLLDLFDVEDVIEELWREQEQDDAVYENLSVDAFVEQIKGEGAAGVEGGGGDEQ